MRSPCLRHRSSRKLIGLAALALILTGKHVPAAPDENTRLILQVMTNETKKPVASAHIVLHFVSGKKFFIKDKRATWEAQTNRRGEVILDDLPQGHVKIQVIAKGYQTFGDEFELSKSEETLTILMKPPAKQVSAY
jgi:hypothetical protein